MLPDKALGQLLLFLLPVLEKVSAAGQGLSPLGGYPAIGPAKGKSGSGSSIHHLLSVLELSLQEGH